MVGSWRAFRYSAKDGLEALPLVPDAHSAAAKFINDAGVTVGESWFSDGTQRAFYHTDALGMQELGLNVGVKEWTQPVDLNSSGQVLMYTIDMQTYEVRPYFYSPEAGAHDLNELLAEPLDFTLVIGHDINDGGRIIAEGRRANRDVSVLLTPISVGDLNCDKGVDFGDINPFVQALTDPSGWQTDYPGCPLLNADVDESGEVDFGDINPFVGLLVES